MGNEIKTARLILRRWEEQDFPEFAKLHGDPEVMGDLGGPITEKECREKFAQYLKNWATCGFGRWCVTTTDGEFLGYVGVNREDADHPIGRHDEIGWRLGRGAWGKGYATEAAQAAIRDAFLRVNLPEILAYTTRENHRSQTVISRLPFARAPSRDFSVPWESLGQWSGMVWATNPRLAANLLKPR